MVANLFDFHYINYRFRSTEDLNCAILLLLSYDENKYWRKPSIHIFIHFNKHQKQ
jgi:hypothetical protein